MAQLIDWSFSDTSILIDSVRRTLADIVLRAAPDDLWKIRHSGIVLLLSSKLGWDGLLPSSWNGLISTSLFNTRCINFTIGDNFDKTPLFRPYTAHMGSEYVSREKKLPMVNFLIFVQNWYIFWSHVSWWFREGQPLFGHKTLILQMKICVPKFPPLPPLLNLNKSGRRRSWDLKAPYIIVT